MAAKKKTPKTAKAAPKRKDPPPLMRDEVLREAGYKCGNPRCQHILTLDLHHIEWVKDGGPTTPSNLLALCPNCHSLHTRGHIPADAIRHWKGLLVALNHAFSRESMDLLLYLASPENTRHVWYSGDGLVRFAGLIAAGLVEIGDSAQVVGQYFAHLNVDPSNPASKTVPHFLSAPATGARVQLSERGELLVKSWLEGDGGSYARALGYHVKSTDVKE